MDLLITFFFWVGWVVFPGVPLSLLAWLLVDHIRHRRDDRPFRGARDA